MEISIAKPEDAEKIIDFLKTVFDDKSIATYCNNLREKLENNEYVSILMNDNNRIVGHSGIAIKDSVAIFNTLALLPSWRGFGLSKPLLSTKVNYISNRKDLNLTHAVGYCVLHHPRSEKIHDHTFKAIGLMPVPGHFLADNDPLKKQSTFYGNLVVCKQLNDFNKDITINYKGPLEEKIWKICSSIGIRVRFKKPCGEKSVDLGDYVQINLDKPDDGQYLKFMERQNYALLGMFPNVYTGLMAFGFMQRKKADYGSTISISCKERKIFANEILDDLQK